MQIFISYEHTAREYADSVCNALESNGYRCWYAPRNVSGDYATAIVNAINNSSMIILLLSEAASKSPHVLNEVELAYQKIISDEIKILPVKIDSVPLSGPMGYYIKRMHWLDVDGLSPERVGERTVAYLRGDYAMKAEESVRSQPQKPERTLFDNTKRNSVVQYYSEDDLVEIKRIAVEHDLLYPYEKPVIDRLVAGKSGLNCLDFYCLDARASLKRFDRPEFCKVIGFSYADNIAAEGNMLCRDNPRYHFAVYNQNTREQDVRRVMLAQGVGGFDFVNIAMAVMDMKNPFKELKWLKNVLNPGAVILVRDVDDGIVMAYPDRSGLFEKIKSFYSKDPMSGSRKSARQIFGTLKKIGAQNIRTELCGVNSASMDFKEKKKMFEAWFSFIPNDFRQAYAKQPDNADFGEIIEWLNEYYDDVEESFFDDDFFFISGYMIFTAEFPE